MAVYKVHQDVEADDKLIGPFSFRQFIYLIIVALAIGLAWGLEQIFIPLAIIPLPIIVLFGALALPLRKDQPMETYLSAIVAFYLKPRRQALAGYDQMKARAKGFVQPDIIKAAQLHESNAIAAAVAAGLPVKPAIIMDIQTAKAYFGI